MKLCHRNNQQLLQVESAFIHVANYNYTSLHKKRFQKAHLELASLCRVGSMHECTGWKLALLWSACALSHPYMGYISFWNLCSFLIKFFKQFIMRCRPHNVIAIGVSSIVNALTNSVQQSAPSVSLQESASSKSQLRSKQSLKAHLQRILWLLVAVSSATFIALWC